MTDYSPPNTFYAHVYGLFENEDMYKFIGKNGAHFKYLTEKLKLDYIWWNKDTNTIELWGPHYRLNFAKKIMNKKLEEYTEKKNKSSNENVEPTNNKKYVKILTRQNP